MKHKSLVLAILPLVMAGSVFAQMPNKPAQNGQQHTPKIIEEADLNKDGLLTLEEMQKMTEVRFKEMDTNKDGKLSTEEIRENGRRMMEKHMKNRQKGNRMQNRPDDREMRGMGHGRENRPLHDCPPCPCMGGEDTPDEMENMYPPSRQ